MERNISLQNGEQILAVFGDFDKNLKKIQTAFDVSIVNRGGDIKISGGETGSVFRYTVPAERTPLNTVMETVLL